ncbi:MAG: S8 family serine peptidase [Actinomycetota bacterium]
MHTRRSLIVALLALSLAVSWIVPASGHPAAREASLPAAFDPDLLSSKASGRAIVGFRHDLGADTMRLLARAGITHAVRLDSIDAVGVLGPTSAYAAIARWDDVRFVDADTPIRGHNYGAKQDTKVTQVRSGAKPLKRPYTGAGVTVAVVDTGIETLHPDLADRVVKHVNFEPSWFMDMINDGVYSDQLSEATGNPIDSYGHGTHVAGIVAGTGESAAGGIDYSGVAPGASLVNLKIADVWEGADCSVPCDFGWEINALVAFEWMIEHRHDPEFPGGIRISTNSWGIYEVDSEVEPIVLIAREAARAGIAVVFSAGNAGPDEYTVGPGPEALPQVIAVGASCKLEVCPEGEIAEFSSRGPQLDVVAPGMAIWSARANLGVLGPLGLAIGATLDGPAPPGEDDPPAMLNNSAFYIPLDGTSMAAPHVAGIIALMLEANAKLTPAQVQRILKSTATDRGKRGFDTTWGAGLVNAHKAVIAAIAAARPKAKR